MSFHFLPGPPPPLDQDEVRPFWEGAKKGEIRFPKCQKCGEFTWYPQPLCRHCSSTDMQWTAIGGKGKIFTWTIVRYPFSPDSKEFVPFINVLVEFDDAPGVRFVSNLIDCKPEDIQIGLPLEPVFHRVNEEVTMPLFRPA